MNWPTQCAAENCERLPFPTTGYCSRYCAETTAFSRACRAAFSKFSYMSPQADRDEWRLILGANDRQPETVPVMLSFKVTL